MNTSITQVLHTLHNAVNNGDYDTLSSCYGSRAKVVATPLSQFSADNTEHHDCVSALQQFQQKFMPEHLVTTGDEIVIEAGDVALVIAKLYLVPKSTPNALPCEGKKALYVMQKQLTGEWRCVIDNFFGTDLVDFA